MLNLDFTDEQDMLREMVRGVMRPARIRRGACEPWRTTRSATRPTCGRSSPSSTCSACCCPSHGGSGMSMLEGVIVYEELGRALAPTPHFVSCVLSAGALVAAGIDRPAGRVAAEDRRAARPSSPRRGSSPRTASARRASQCGPTADGDGFTLTGTKQHVLVRVGGRPPRRAGPHRRRRRATSTSSWSTRRRRA